MKPSRLLLFLGRIKLSTRRDFHEEINLITIELRTSRYSYILFSFFFFLFLHQKFQYTKHEIKFIISIDRMLRF